MAVDLAAERGRQERLAAASARGRAPFFHRAGSGGGGGANAVIQPVVIRQIDASAGTLTCETVRDGGTPPDPTQVPTGTGSFFTMYPWYAMSVYDYLTFDWEGPVARQTTIFFAIYDSGQWRVPLLPKLRAIHPPPNYPLSSLTPVAGV